MQQAERLSSTVQMAPPRWSHRPVAPAPQPFLAVCAARRGPGEPARRDGHIQPASPPPPPPLAQSCFRGMPGGAATNGFWRGLRLLTGVLCGVLAGAMWGMVFIVPELLPAFSPVELAVGRYTAYGAISLGLMAPKLASLLRRLAPRDYLALVRQALSGNLVYYMLLALGVKLAGVAPTSLIIGLIPVAVTLLGRRDRGAVPLARLALPLLIVAVAIACINVDAFRHAQASDAGASSVLLGVAC